MQDFIHYADQFEFITIKFVLVILTVNGAFNFVRDELGRHRKGRNPPAKDEKTEPNDNK